MTLEIQESSSHSTDECYRISFNNCNNIDTGSIELYKDKLNIKYGANGTGKSTIARALHHRNKKIEDFQKLTPFKLQNSATEATPAITGADQIEHVLLFDEDYVSNFAFQKDEVLLNSFEVFINTPDYQQGLRDIQTLLSGLPDAFSDQPEIAQAISSFEELKAAFSITKSGALSHAAKGYKALAMVSKVNNVPDELEGYRGFIESDDPARWVDWQSKGKAFMEHSENCPFCSAPALDKAVAERVSKEYESASLKTLTTIRRVIDKIGEYIKPEDLLKLRQITTSIDELTTDQITFLTAIRIQIVYFLDKLIAARDISYYALRDENNIQEKLSHLKIDHSLIPMLISERTVSVADMINAKLDDVSRQIEQVGNKVGSLRAKVNKLVETNQASINDFLKSAGYKYSVKILSGGDSYRMILEHHDATGHLDAATTHLSYGEKNAFALVLFMHHVKQAKPDLAILDDPVSSFDKTKKFAIMHKLFHDDNGIRNFTTLFLTHDIEPVIDVLVSGPLRRGLAGRSVAHFLRTEVGVLREKAIARGDVSTFAQICDSNISSASDATIKCIYLRRKLEVGGDYGSAYQLLSSFLHLRQPATKTGADDRQVGMTASEIQDGVAEIRCHIPEFDYDLLVAELLVPGALIERFDAATAGYEKVQIFRIFLKLPMVEKKGSTPFQKFVNESLHIENEYVMQLNPRDFDAVPEYIVDECAKLIDVHRD